MLKGWFVAFVLSIFCLYPIVSLASEYDDWSGYNGDDSYYDDDGAGDSAYASPGYQTVYNNQPEYYDDAYYDDGGRQQEAFYYSDARGRSTRHSANYASRLPGHISGHGEKVIVIDPRVHAWGAYDASGNLIRAGLVTAGANYCRDIGRGCRTKAGTFRIFSLGSSGCRSRKYPLPRGGAPMPYCMFFNGGQGIHGSYELAEANLSHGCVRVSVSDAEWIRFNFANHGTKVIVRPY